MHRFTVTRVIQAASCAGLKKTGGLFQVLEERVLYCIFRFLGAAQNGKRGAVELGFIAEDKRPPSPPAGWTSVP